MVLRMFLRTWRSPLREELDCLLSGSDDSVGPVDCGRPPANWRRTRYSSEDKWGVEACPVAFQERYKSYLDQEVTSSMPWSNYVDRFADALQDAVVVLRLGR